MAKRGKSRGLEYNIRRDKTVRRVTRMYWILGIGVIVSIMFNMIVQGGIYTKTATQMANSVQTVQTFMTIQDDFDEINRNVLLVISSLETKNGESIAEESVKKIESDFSELDKLINRTAEINGETTGPMRDQFENVINAIHAYEEQINEMKSRLGELTAEEGMQIYKEVLEPAQRSAAENLQATLAMGQEVSQKNTAMGQRIRMVIQVILFLVLIGIIVLVVVIGKRQIGSIIEIRQKEQEITEAGNRLTKSRKKLMDSAMTNILTGMGNRYALDASLSQRIGNAQFNIAVFDIDNFRMVNDMYSYEFGDEYLAAIAERLKEEFTEYAEMFNITGNEFCMVFKDHISDPQAQQLAEQIRQFIGQPMVIAGVPVQTTVSSSLYHYLPSDNLEVNTLLMKMDSALHAAKRDGGNRLYQIQ